MQRILKGFKSRINTLLGKFGYRVVRASAGDLVMTAQDFAGLVRPYELLLNRLHGPGSIPENERRIAILQRLTGISLAEAYFIVEALAETANIAGDVCEFGVGQGETTALIANEIRDADKTLHLFDNFAGLPPPSSKDELRDDIFNLGSIEAYTGTMSCPPDLVLSRLDAVDFPRRRYVIHEGYFDDVIRTGEDLPQQVAFAFVDFDFYEPIKGALDYLHEITPHGAVIVADDYDHFSTGAKTAIDEFIAARNAQRQTYEVEIPDKRFGCFAVLRRRG